MLKVYLLIFEITIKINGDLMFLFDIGNILKIWYLQKPGKTVFTFWKYSKDHISRHSHILERRSLHFGNIQKIIFLEILIT